MSHITDDQIERLGKLADSLDAALYPMRLPLPDTMKIEGMSGSMREARDEIAKLVIEISGDNPWATNPMEG